MYTDNNVCINLKGNFMKIASALIATLFATSAFAYVAPSQPTPAATASAPAATATAKKVEKKVAKKETAKPAKSEAAPAAKTEATKK
jgi:hypothetical protein